MLSNGLAKHCVKKPPARDTSGACGGGGEHDGSGIPVTTPGRLFRSRYGANGAASLTGYDTQPPYRVALLGERGRCVAARSFWFKR